MGKSFSEKGYIIVRSAISQKLVKKIQKEIFNVLKIRKKKIMKNTHPFADW